MDLGLVAAEAAVVAAEYRQVLVDAGEDGLAVAALEQGRRQGSRRGPVGGSGLHSAVAPDRVRILRREIGMEPGIGRHRRNRHYVADLGEELVPPLMREDLLERRRPRAALDRPASGDGISERVVRVAVAAGSGEVDMIRQPFGG